MKSLNIAIPTYKRPIQLKKCLDSILVSVKNLKNKENLYLGITIINNSNIYVSKYDELIKDYKKKFNKKVKYFKYIISGFNIGMTNNISAAFINNELDYNWVLPDDDVARFDSLCSLFKVINMHKPSLIVGGWINKSKIGYNDNKIKNDDNKSNKIYKIINNKNKISVFLKKNIVQAQEYVYLNSQIKNFFLDDSNLKLLDPMIHGLLAIYCLQNKKPLILMEKSIGLFRHDEPNISEWRHLWLKLSLIDWPLLSNEMYKKKWLTKKQLVLSKNIFASLLFSAVPHRPDVLLGINKNFKLSFSKLYSIYGFIYLKAVFASFFKLINKIFFRFLKIS